MADYSNAVTKFLRDGEILVTTDGSRIQCLFLEIDKGAVRLLKRYKHDSVSNDEYYGVTRTYLIAKAERGNLAIDTEELRNDLKEGGKLAVLIDEIIAGLSVDSNAQGTRIGTLDHYAEYAEGKLEKALSDSAYVDSDKRVWTPGEWLFSSGETDRAMLKSIGLEASSYDVEVGCAAIKVRSDAKDGGDIIIGDLEGEIFSALERLREQLAESV